MSVLLGSGLWKKLKYTDKQFHRTKVHDWNAGECSYP
jgi:hypothetical protein